MANVYFQSSVQLVFAVKNRKALIIPSMQEEMHSYIGGVLLNQKHKPLAINSVEDHIHILLGMYPCDIPALVRDIKSESSRWVNDRKFMPYHFNWQSGYGFFTYSLGDRPDVIRYIQNQPVHHQKQTFQKEYIGMLDNAGIEYDERYLFDFFE